MEPNVDALVQHRTVIDGTPLRRRKEARSRGNGRRRSGQTDGRGQGSPPRPPRPPSLSVCIADTDQSAVTTAKQSAFPPNRKPPRPACGALRAAPETMAAAALRKVTRLLGSVRPLYRGHRPVAVLQQVNTGTRLGYLLSFPGTKKKKTTHLGCVLNSSDLNSPVQCLFGHASEIEFKPVVFFFPDVESR